MKSSQLIVPLIASLLWFAPAGAATPDQLSAIAGMGQLNGVALQCRYMDQMQRIKLTLVVHLPKQRVLGDWFEQATNDSFMNFMSNNSSCPDSQDFTQQVDAAIKQIELNFKQ